MWTRQSLRKFWTVGLFDILYPGVVNTRRIVTVSCSREVSDFRSSGILCLQRSSGSLSRYYSSLLWDDSGTPSIKDVLVFFNLPVKGVSSLYERWGVGLRSLDLFENVLVTV